MVGRKHVVELAEDRVILAVIFGCLLDKLVTTLYILLLGFQFEQPFDFYQPDVEASSRGG